MPDPSLGPADILEATDWPSPAPHSAATLSGPRCSSPPGLSSDARREALDAPV